jgi:hypothetical protein
MTVYYLFSRNPKVGSRIISWASGLLVKDLDKVPSHMAILIEQEGYEPLVFESTFDSGVRIVPYLNWQAHNEECYKILCPTNKNVEHIFSKVHDYWGKKYDWGGVTFFGLCFLRNYFFKTPFPKTNSWQLSNRYFCNELGGEIAEYPKYSMVTPAKMCSDFLKLKKE